ncbi:MULTISPECIES: 5-formyltetrahydrofolate cyclo-ligase [unclassified Crossiella]|uniref:5-formyltetrahydrofolate cyclo-ligase n=1 Tax=unclassified Crossiella TaxID=2620835 RepID=UPI001FFEA9A4|nr:MULTISPECIES: 5-formyltetrahydrofolate cyclo-ligase [unclassified Crossiella]MCK2238128.1 5-formyltetrahydrofolate cyclo-ligase [Crossiella sp. S99.2]MCK2256168.1 5-formyltetrahydrofolate cyclo-ligase [Crossiella sp. S99.1]
MSAVTSKNEWRTRLTAARRALSAPVRAAEATALAAAAAEWAALLDGPVAAYVPVGAEPGSPALLDALRAAGRRVLLPIVVGAAPLDWAEYAGPESLTPARYGLLEPNGPRLGPAAVAEVAGLLVPALAVDRAGVRLGRGAGHYDRSLPLVRAGVPVLAVVRDEELVDRLPAEPHDIRMTGALTPDGGLVEFPERV